MDARLKQSLFHFCRVYQNNVDEILHEQLPTDVANLLNEKLDEQFAAFEESLFNRLAEDLGR